MERYAAFGVTLDCDSPLSYLRALPAPSRDDAPDRFELLCGEVSPDPPEGWAHAHHEPDFEGGPILDIWVDAPCQRAHVDYAGWRVLVNGVTRRMIYTNRIASPTVELRFVCERVLLPLAMLLDPTREILAMHGGAFLFDDRGWLVIGASGAGKSTSAFELVKQGARLFSDDMALIDVAAGTILPGSPSLRLWRQQIALPSESAPILGLSEKRWFRLEDEAASYQGAPLAGVILLEVDPERPCAGERDRIAGLHALVSILENCFDLERAPDVWQRARMKRARALLEMTTIWRCRYARDPGGEPRQIEAILEIVRPQVGLS